MTSRCAAGVSGRRLLKKLTYTPSDPSGCPGPSFNLYSTHAPDVGKPQKTGVIMVTHASHWSRGLAGGLLLAALLAQAAQRPEGRRDRGKRGDGRRAARQASQAAEKGVHLCPPGIPGRVGMALRSLGNGCTQGGYHLHCRHQEADQPGCSGIPLLRSHHFAGAVPLPLSVRGGSRLSGAFQPGGGDSSGVFQAGRIHGGG